MKKINMVMGGMIGAAPAAHADSKPRTMAEEMQALRGLGLKVGRG